MEFKKGDRVEHISSGIKGTVMIVFPWSYSGISTCGKKTVWVDWDTFTSEYCNVQFTNQITKLI